MVIDKTTRMASNQTTREISEPEKTINQTTHKGTTTNQAIRKNYAENAVKQTIIPTNAAHNKTDTSITFKLTNGTQRQPHQKTHQVISNHQTWQT